jgi:hypothetical protein
MPVCTKDNPAPKGEPIYPGAVVAHIARPDWEHPDTTEHEATTSIDFKSVKWVTCNHCGGNLP